MLSILIISILINFVVSVGRNFDCNNFLLNRHINMMETIGTSPKPHQKISFMVQHIELEFVVCLQQQTLLFIVIQKSWVWSVFWKMKRFPPELTGVSMKIIFITLIHAMASFLNLIRIQKPSQKPAIYVSLHYSKLHVEAWFFYKKNIFQVITNVLFMIYLECTEL